MLSRIGEILFSNLGIKLGSVALACLVYFHIYSQKEREVVLSVPLHYVSLPSSLTFANDPPGDLRLRVRGSLDQILRFKFKSGGVEVSLGEAVPGRFQRALSPPDVLVPMGVVAQVTEVVEPKLVTVEVDSLLTRTVAVLPRIEGVPADGFEISALPTVSPAWVLLRGPGRALARIDSLRTAPVRIEGLRESRSFTVRIEILQPRVSTSAEQAVVTVPISRTSMDRGSRRTASRTALGG